MAQKTPSVTLIHHDFHDPIYTQDEQANFKVEAERVLKNIQILEDQLKLERAKLAGLKHLLK